MSPRKRRPRPPSTDPAVGERLRKARLQRGLTIKAVASRAGLTESFVSLLERNRVNPTVASLQKVARAVGTSLGRLFDDAHPAHGRVVRRHERVQLKFPWLRATDYLVSPNLSGKLEVIWAEADPGGGSGDEFYTHDGDEECVLVIKGRMEIWIGDERCLLNTGDAVTFSSRIPHKWRNIGRGKLLAVWALTPPSY
ncbi:MAG TPA: cupin domain-containing protein [bacterium]|nr:cupin domain-containing protein [bacterium]